MWPPLAGPGQLGVELLLAAEQAAARHAHVVEHDLGGVRGADAVLLVLLPLATGPCVPGGTMKLAWPRPFSSGSTAATTTCTSAMPPLVIHALVPLSTHSSLASSYTARVRSDDTSEPASGSLTQNAPSCDLVGVP